MRTEGGRPATAGLAAMALVAAGCGGTADPQAPFGNPSAWSRDPDRAAVEITVDLQAAHDGRIPVEVIAMDGRPTQFGVESAWTDGYAFHDVRFTDGEGNPLAYDEGAGRFSVPKPTGKVVVLNYEAEPGGAGRHGRQGVVADDHALFDGRLFLLPRGAVPVGSARIRFVTPDGWSVASPFREEDSWFYVDAFDPHLTAKVLGASCIGVGLFDRSVRRIGEMETRVASYANWDDAHRRRLEDKTFRMLEYFHDELGFDLGAPYSVVWVPAPQRVRIFGGSYANGTCFEDPTARHRNWELLGHRIAHAMNEYRPSGMSVADPEDSWFTEGWASYMEARATGATGLDEGENRWDDLLRSYKRTKQRFPGRDLPLAREREAEDETREFVHYVKAPLAMKMLERMVVARSGRSLEQFMASMWVEYGWHQKPFPFREKLEAFAGASFEDFWALMVRRRGQVVPVWAEYLTPGRLERMRQPPAATVGGDPLSGDYLFQLAWSGNFKSFRDVASFTEREAARRRRLAKAGVQLYPDEIRDHLFALDGDDRYALARLERSYPLYLLEEGGGAQGGSGSGEKPILLPNPEQQDGRMFADLLARERGAATVGARRRGTGLVVRTPGVPATGAGPARLAFGDGVHLTVGVRGPDAPPRGEVAVIADGLEVSRKALEPGEGPVAQAAFEPADRPSGNRILVLRIEGAGVDQPVARAYWQRSGPHSASRQPSVVDPG